MDELPHWTPAELSARSGLSLRTTRRWRQTGRVPAWAHVLIRLLCGGYLGAIDPAWGAWALRNGHLCGPDGFTFEAREILSLPFLARQISAYQAEQRFERQADWISGRWEARRAEAQDARAVALFSTPPAPPEDYSYLAPGIAKRRVRR